MHFEKTSNLLPKKNNTILKQRVSNSADSIKLKKPKKIKYYSTNQKPRTYSLKKKLEILTEKNSLRNSNLINSKKTKAFGNQIRKKLPWITNITKKAEKALKFHFEIFDFLNFITPSKDENNKRLRTYYLLQSLIIKKWPTWKVQVYGSFLVNLHLKDSDFDFTVFKSNNMNFSSDNFTDYDDISDYDMLSSIHDYLIESKFAEENNIQLISAKVPIIKCICKETKIHIDLRYFYSFKSLN